MKFKQSKVGEIPLTNSPRPKFDHPLNHSISEDVVRNAIEKCTVKNVRYGDISINRHSIVNKECLLKELGLQ